MATSPTLGYGQRGEVAIDSVNQWMRGQPWYQQLIRSFGQTPANVHLSDNQKQAVIREAQANGVVVDEGHNGQEVDDSGNFQAKSHALRNTLIVGGLAAATLLTAGGAGAAWGIGPAWGAAGGSSAAAGGAAALGPSTAANLAATSAIVGGSTVPAGLAAAGAGGAAVAGLSYADLLKYGLPVAGNLVGGLIQAHATSDASDAQQKYLEEALAYQKEQDTYARTRQAGLDAQEVQRYGGYQDRIAPFIANGTSSNDRMAALLGLPARSGGSGGSYGASSGGSQGVALSPEITARVLQNYKDLGITPTGAGTGPTDSAYFANKVAETGGLTDANSGYWFGRGGRVASELAKAGVTGTPSAPPAAAATPPAAAAPTTSAASVQMRGPDGSLKTVPADQVAHYQQLGATVIGAAA